MSDIILRMIPADGAKPAQLIGYAAVWNSLSVPITDKKGTFRERILPGAFTRALAAGTDIRALVNHQFSNILGRTSAGTLRLAQDDVGLRMECDLPDTSYARDLATSVARGDITGMSFAGTVTAAGVTISRTGGEVIQEIKEVESLKEVTCTSIPAYEGTQLMLRSDASLMGDVPQDEPVKCNLVNLYKEWFSLQI